METITLGIEGMSCGGCVTSVSNALGRVQGVKKVTVSLQKKEAVVEGEGLDAKKLGEVVEDAGYELRA
jgi:copper chaperone